MSRIIPIQDAADPQVAAYRQVRERDLTDREGRFIAEGEVVLRVLLTRSPFQVASVFLLESRLRPLGDLLSRLPTEIPVYAASQETMSHVAGFPIHRGVLAVGRRPEAPLPAGILKHLGPASLVLGLIGIANHDNMGGLFRNAAAFGAEAVMLDATCCDPLYRKAIRVSVGASLIVPFARAGSADDLVTRLAAAGFDLVALSPGGREPLSAVRREGRTALLLGAEGPGLPPSVMARTRTVQIPMAAGFDSLNVATAAGIALHHLSTS